MNFAESLQQDSAGVGAQDVSRVNLIAWCCSIVLTVRVVWR